MSRADQPDPSAPADTLTDEERAAFERLYERFDGDVAAIAEAVLQSSVPNEEANS